MLYNTIYLLEQLELLGQQHGYRIDIQGFPTIEAKEFIPLYPGIIEGVLPGYSHGNVVIIRCIIQAIHNVVAYLKLFTYVFKGLKRKKKR